jgi:hypothetical protein
LHHEVRLLVRARAEPLELVDQRGQIVGWQRTFVERLVAAKPDETAPGQRPGRAQSEPISQDGDERGAELEPLHVHLRNVRSPRYGDVKRVIPLARR